MEHKERTHHEDDRDVTGLPQGNHDHAREQDLAEGVHHEGFTEFYHVFWLAVVVHFEVVFVDVGVAGLEFIFRVFRFKRSTSAGTEAVICVGQQSFLSIWSG